MTDAPRDLTAERAAAIAEQIVRALNVSPDTANVMAVVPWVQRARQEALREAARVCSEWYKIDRTDIHTVAEMAEVLATTLDRLASEGG